MPFSFGTNFSPCSSGAQNDNVRPVPQPRPPWTRSPAARARRYTTPPPVPCHASGPTRSPLARCASLRGGAFPVRHVATTKEGRSAAKNISVLRSYLAHDLHGSSTSSIFQQETYRAENRGQGGRWGSRVKHLKIASETCR